MYRALAIFFGLWALDLFMQKVQNNGDCSLSYPNEAPALADSWGQKFEDMYKKYEREVRLKRYSYIWR